MLERGALFASGARRRGSGILEKVGAWGGDRCQNILPPRQYYYPRRLVRAISNDVWGPDHYQVRAGLLSYRHIGSVQQPLAVRWMRRRWSGPCCSSLGSRSASGKGCRGTKGPTPAWNHSGIWKSRRHDRWLMPGRVLVWGIKKTQLFLSAVFNFKI